MCCRSLAQCCQHGNRIANLILDLLQDDDMILHLLYMYNVYTLFATSSSQAAFVLKLAQVEEWPMLCELLDKAAMDSTVYNAFSTLLGSLDGLDKDGDWSRCGALVLGPKKHGVIVSPKLPLYSWQFIRTSVLLILRCPFTSPGESLQRFRSALRMLCSLSFSQDSGRLPDGPSLQSLLGWKHFDAPNARRLVRCCE